MSDAERIRRAQGTRATVFVLAAAGIGTALIAASTTEGAWGPRWERVSVTSQGGQRGTGVYGAESAAVSADGRYVAFGSNARHMVPGDRGRSDVFLRDRSAGTTIKVTTAVDGREASSDSIQPSISADGQVITFTSWADNLVAGDTGRRADAFVADMRTGSLMQIRGMSGSQGNGPVESSVVSGDGNVVAFASFASNLVDDSDTNRTWDVFAFDRRTGSIERLSSTPSGRPGDAYSGVGFPLSISFDGRFVAFTSLANDLVADDTNGAPDVFVHDRLTNRTERVDADAAGHEANEGAFGGSITADGRYVSFVSLSDNLVPGSSGFESFVKDRVTGAIERVSVRSDGTAPAAGGAVADSSISADGHYVCFSSRSGDLVPGDTNGEYDVFVHDRHTGALARVSVRPRHDYVGPPESRAGAKQCSLDADGSVAVDLSSAAVIPADTNGTSDVYAWNR